MWYHFAFMAISVALFGMTVGAVLVYLLPRVFDPRRVHVQLTVSSMAFAVAILASFLLHLRIPFRMEASAGAVAALGATYLVIAVPFILSGVAICLVLTRFGASVSRLYAADLVGAAMGCLAFIVILNATSAPRAVVFVAGLAALGAMAFGFETGKPALRSAAGLLAVGFLLFGSLSADKTPWADQMFRLVWVKGQKEVPALLERWNSFSRITVMGLPGESVRPFGWGFSPEMPEDLRVKQLRVDIDAGASTFLTNFEGDPANLEFLRYDITNLAHRIRSDADVLVIGAGGGRDLLSALLFDQASVIGVEINRTIVDLVTGPLGDFTGHLDADPRVTFVVDEARSYITRSEANYDLIQISLIDTWAATAAGAFVLSENALYTVEAWQTFIEHLKSGGILSVSRWYYRDRPAEMYRLVSLAAAALREAGVENPREHLYVARTPISEGRAIGVGTLLLCRDPFTDADLAALGAATRELSFDTVLSCTESSDPFFAALCEEVNPAVPASIGRLDISPPTDDRPFFFNMLRFRDMFDRDLWELGNMSFNLKAVAMLGGLLILVVVLSAIFILVPLALTARSLGGERIAAPLVYFSAIGLGFMFIEISQMQRLIVFLGHPTFALSVVLTTMLLASGIGSLLTNSVAESRLRSAGLMRVGALVAVLVAFGLVTPALIDAFEGAVAPGRIAVAVAILAPLGLFMGMCFPLGMRAASQISPGLTPWLWAVNGAMSVCASVFAIAIAMAWGISISYWTGAACYAVALPAYGLMTVGASMKKNHDGTTDTTRVT